MKNEKARIIKNSAQCLHCMDIIESKHTHDFVSCRCGKLCVDGGRDYLRRIGELNNYKDLSEYEEER